MATTSEPVQPIDIRRSRNFSEQLNITFAFLRQNFRKLGKAILYIVGPVGALSTILMDNTLAGEGTVPSMLSGFLLYGIAWILTVAVMNGYVFLYLDRGYDGFDIKDIWEDVKWGFGKIIATGGGLAMLAVAGYICMVVALTMQLALGLLAAICLIFGFIYFFIRLTPLFTARLYEDLSFSEAMARCKELMQGNWWMTFCIIAVVQVIALALNLVAGAPAYIIEFGLAIDPYMFEITDTTMLVVEVFNKIGTFAGIIFNALVILAGTLHYFNLVEKFDGVGLMDRIDQLGGEEPVPLNDEDAGALETR